MLIEGSGAARSTPRRSGFTLIELIVTISLFGTLVALGLPSFITWTRNSQVRTVAEALQTGIRTAQAEAVRRNQPVVLSFTNAAPALNATAVAGGKNWSLQSIAQFDVAAEYITGGALADVASNVVIADHAMAGISAICFNSNGRLVANSAPGVPDAACALAVTAFDVSHPSSDRPLRVVVQIGGQLRMCDPKRPVLSATTPDGCPA